MSVFVPVSECLALDELRSAWRGADGQPIALVPAGGVPSLRTDVTEGSAAADLTFLVTDPSGGTRGRGAGQLTKPLWERAPVVSQCLGQAPLDAGGVLIAEAFLGTWLANCPPTRRPVSLAATVDQWITGGASVAAKMLGELTPTAVNPPPLKPTGSTRADLASRLSRMPIGIELPPHDATALRALLLLWHDLLEESHALSQSIEGAVTVRQGCRFALGDYAHAIMHRREGDFGNAKYWLRRAGKSPVDAELLARAEAAGLGEKLAPRGRWDAAAFVDACQEAMHTPESPHTAALCRLQSDELLLLMTVLCASPYPS